MLGGTRMHWYQTGGGAIERWKDPQSEYWQLFDEQIAGKTISGAWFQICDHPQDGTTYADVIDVLDLLESRLEPGIVVFASGLEIFDPPDLCSICGPDVPVVTREWADQLAADGRAQRGPDLGPLTEDLTSDGCHPDMEGMQVTGQQLLDFFGP